LGCFATEEKAERGTINMISGCFTVQEEVDYEAIHLDSGYFASRKEKAGLILLGINEDAD
jgi:hypothetical protein